MKIKLPLLFTAFITLFSVQNLFAMDIVKLNPGRSSKDNRSLFKVEIITEALKLTKQEYGKFKVEVDDSETTNSRAIQAMQSGDKINTFVALTNQEWEEKTLAIKIPVRRGILNYRLLLVNKDNLDKFKGVKNISDLRKLQVGLLRDWATTDVMKKNNLNVSLSHSYTGLFSVLSSNRIDYIPRGVNEIYDELANSKNADNLVVEPNIALYIPTATYIFVSPEEPRLAKRITKGLEMMLKNSSLNKIFDKYYQDKLVSADLDSRRIIYLKNKELSKDAVFSRKNLWFQHDTSLLDGILKYN